MDYSVLATGSSGNCVIINRAIAIDMGVPYKKIAPYAHDLKLVLLTHIHLQRDHFKPRTAAALHRERPALRWGCCEWMVKPLLEAGVSARAIDLLPLEREVSYRGLLRIEAFEVPHNVRNCGYKLRFGAERVFYCTDCATLDNVSAHGYDWLFIEANRTEAEFEAAIAAKKAAGQFAYEEAARRNHLSREQAEAWLARNAGPHSRYVFLHQHTG